MKNVLWFLKVWWLVLSFSQQKSETKSIFKESTGKYPIKKYLTLKIMPNNFFYVFHWIFSVGIFSSWPKKLSEDIFHEDILNCPNFFCSKPTAEIFFIEKKITAEIIFFKRKIKQGIASDHFRISLMSSKTLRASYQEAPMHGKTYQTCSSELQTYEKY